MNKGFGHLTALFHSLIASLVIFPVHYHIIHIITLPHFFIVSLTHCFITSLFHLLIDKLPQRAKNDTLP